MSLYQRKTKSKIWHYDFQLRGHRFYGSTGVTSKAEAREVLKQQRVKAERQLALGEENHQITVKEVCAIYLAQRGQFTDDPKTVETWCKWIVIDLGGNTRLQDVTYKDLQTIVAKRRKGRANGTVNRQFTELFRRCWRHAAPEIKQPNWGKLLLPEPRERIREISSHEQAAIVDHLRPDLVDAFLRSIETGMRQREVINLKWRDIDLSAGVIKVLCKGDKTRLLPLLNVCQTILKRNRHHISNVFTFQQQRASHGRRKGEYRPLTKTALRRPWVDAMNAAGIDDLVWHDTRHTAATRLLRRVNNLALVQQLLGHEVITTTRKYANTTVEDLRRAMNTPSVNQCFTRN